MPFGIKFNTSPFIHTLYGRRANRWLKGFLDGIGHERLAWLISNNRSLISLFPPEQVKETVLQNPLPQQFLDEFPDEEVYEWLPQEYRSFIEDTPGGKEWAMGQITFLRTVVVIKQ